MNVLLDQNVPWSECLDRSGSELFGNLSQLINSHGMLSAGTLGNWKAYFPQSFARKTCSRTTLLPSLLLITTLESTSCSPFPSAIDIYLTKCYMQRTDERFQAFLILRPPWIGYDSRTRSYPGGPTEAAHSLQNAWYNNPFFSSVEYIWRQEVPRVERWLAP
jgi:hypothetical protein